MERDGQHSHSPVLDFRTDAYDYALPRERIAQTPTEPRDSARLLMLARSGVAVAHHFFYELDRLLHPGDLLVANRTRVLPARLSGRRVGSGGRVEALLLAQYDAESWEALVRPGRRLRPGSEVEFERQGRVMKVEVGDRLSNGGRLLRLPRGESSKQLLALGTPPLPPYIKHREVDPDRYQTVYGDRLGSAAAPTAGLHFTSALLERLVRRGVRLEFITLHVGTDTFRPIRRDRVDEHELHAEWAEVDAGVLAALAQTRARGGRVVAVGTTTVRALESAAPATAHPGGWRGWTDLYIGPGHHFQHIDAILTNFHLPRSTLLVLVSAFAGRERVLAAYQAAIAEGYRFYSFGDAMLLS